MKSCSQCKVLKPESEFHKHQRGINGLHSQCRGCISEKTRIYRLKNKDKINASNQKWREAHKEELNAYNAERRPNYYPNNRDKVRAARAEYYQRNKPKVMARIRKRQIDKIKATPPWADLKAIEAIYILCSQVTKVTGVVHHVDHIHPLKGKNFCGLHVSWNLQVIPGEDNIRKLNKLPEAVNA